MDETRVSELEAKVAQLTAQIERLTAGGEERAEGLAQRSSRRNMLKLAGAATVGAAAAAVGGSVGSVAAANGDPMLHGNALTANNQASAVTRLQTTAANGGAAYEFQAGTTYGNSAAEFPCAVGAWTETEGFPTGLYAYTETIAAGFGLVGWGEGALSSGAFLRGTKANVLLDAAGLAGPARGGAHVAGELIEDATGALWLCVHAGTPGTWRKLAGNETAGAFHPISQVRVFDSRSPAPTPGKLATGANRVVSVKDGRDPTSGSVNAASVVPAGATAVAGNITVANTTGNFGGFLTIMPGDAGGPVGSSINWFGPNQIIANSFVAKLDANRQLKIFAGGATNDTDFIIDIGGFYL